MKKLFLVLLVLGLAVPVGANVLIYNSKQANTGVSYDWGDWEQYKESEVAYIIVEPYGNGTAGIWAINLWKEKDKAGKTTKYVEADEVGDVDLIEAQTEKKMMWIISAEDVNDRTLLMGEAKPTKIDTETVVVAASLTGYSIWDVSENLNERDLGSQKVTMKLNKKFTLEAHLRGLTHGSDAMDALVEFLVVEEGYEVAP